MRGALRSPVQLDLFAEPASRREGLEAAERSLQAIYDDLASRWGLPPARVLLSMRRATGGAIRYGPPHLIRISSHMSEGDQKETLLHETAHAICHARWGSDEGHSRRFWSIARSLGVRRRSAPETDRLVAVRLTNARYSYRCPGCSAEWTRRRPFGHARLCASCERAGRPARLVLVRRPARRRA